jgi:hypothetical protein
MGIEHLKMTENKLGKFLKKDGAIANKLTFITFGLLQLLQNTPCIYTGFS